MASSTALRLTTGPRPDSPDARGSCHGGELGVDPAAVRAKLVAGGRGVLSYPATRWILALLAQTVEEVEPSVGALLQRLLERLAGGEVNDGPRFGGDPGVGGAGPVELGGNAAAREDGVPGSRTAGGALVGSLVALGSGPVGGSLDRFGGVTGGAEPHDQGTGFMCMVNVDQPFLAADGLTSSLTFMNLQPAGNDGTQGTSEADGTDWAISHSSRSAAQSRLVRLSSVVVWSLFSTASRAAGSGVLPAAPPAAVGQPGGRSSVGSGSGAAVRATAAGTRRADPGPARAASGAAGRAGPAHGRRRTPR